MWNIIEYAATIIECVICADFAVRFLNPKTTKHKVLCFILIVLFDAMVTTTLNRIVSFEGVLGFIRIIGNFLTVFLFTKGTIFEKILLPVLIDTGLLIISFVSLNTMSFIFDISATDLINSAGLIRIIILFITKFAFFIFTRLMIKIKQNDIYMLSLTEWITLILVFIVTVFAEMEICSVILKYNLSTDNPSIVAVVLGLIFVNIVTYILLVRISKSNTERTMLLIDKMQLENYKNQLAETEKQYNDMKTLRHDMRNHLQCISELVSKGDVVQAKTYISDMLENKLNFVYQFVSTGNKVLNVIANTKLTECKNENIITNINVSNFNLNIDDVDLCIILGNLFDNAIEACRRNIKDKIICFEISQIKSYVKIVIKNSIEKSVLENNPKLITNKSEGIIHGIGLRSVKETISKHEGMIDFYEKEDFFIVDVWLPSHRLL